MILIVELLQGQFGQRLHRIALIQSNQLISDEHFFGRRYEMAPFIVDFFPS